MDMPAEPSASFDCRATSAVLHSGASVALAGHAAAFIAAVLLRSAGWIALCALLVWCVVIYLATRVKMDAQFFELLADHPADQLDAWLATAGLRKNSSPRTIPERRRGALRLWRALAAAFTIEIAFVLAGAFRSLS